MQLVRDISHNISMIDILIICEPERLLVLRLVAPEAVLAAGNSEGRLRTTVACSATLQPTINAQLTYRPQTHTLTAPPGPSSARNFTDVPCL